MRIVWLLCTFALMSACGKGGNAPAAGSAPAKEPALATMQVDGHTVSVRAETTSPAVGQSAVVHVSLTPAAGYHVNTEGYPHTLKVVPADGATCAKVAFEEADAKVAAEQIDFPVACVLAAAGPKTFAADFSVGVCNDGGCKDKAGRIQWTMSAK